MNLETWQIILLALAAWPLIGVIVATSWLLLGTIVSVLMGSWLPGIFAGKDGRRAARQYFGWSALGGPFAIIGIPIVLFD